MANRIAKWLLFTVLFAFIPMIIAILILFMTDKAFNTYNFNGEILFFIIMLSATSIYDMVDLNKSSNVTRTIFIAFFILLVIFSTGIYFIVLYSQLIDTLFLSQERIFAISVTMACLCFILGTIIQIILNRKAEV